MNFKDELIKAGVIKKGHFKLTSGRHSDTYINKDGIYSNPELFGETVKLLCSYYRDGFQRYEYDNLNQIDVITGPALAGAILAAPIALRTGKIFVYPEKVPVTAHGASFMGKMSYQTSMQLRRGYDQIVKGKKVLLIEDIITTGKSVAETMEVVYRSGGTVVEIRCIWNRSMMTEFPVGVRTENNENIPILSIINDPVESWEPEECPVCGRCQHAPKDIDKRFCKANRPCGYECADRCGEFSTVPLTDPKTGEVIS